jgi:hypothetical protein
LNVRGVLLQCWQCALHASPPPSVATGAAAAALFLSGNSEVLSTTDLAACVRVLSTVLSRFSTSLNRSMVALLESQLLVAMPWELRHAHAAVLHTAEPSARLCTTAPAPQQEVLLVDDTGWR